MSLPAVGENLPSTLIYTKELDIQLECDCFETSASLDGLAPFLKSVLRAIPNLQTFRYEIHYFSDVGIGVVKCLPDSD
jgi:hypothetical protein